MTDAEIRELADELERIGQHFTSLLSLGRLLEQLRPSGPVAAEIRQLHRRFAAAYITYGQSLHRLIDAIESTEGTHVDRPAQPHADQPRSGELRTQDPRA